ncbi:hypothetical protein [Sphingobacterium detergens]|uniref:hypothetical protein n=1 Tax=Sphingobacterium detergens TaxID=1145106 RepID=UPI003AB013F5
MSQIINNGWRKNSTTLAELVAIVGGGYGLSEWCYNQGIWTFTSQHQLVFPQLVENIGLFLSSLLVVFLLVNFLLLVKALLERHGWDWQIFGINSAIFSCPFLFLGVLLLLFSKPLGGLELFAALIFSFTIGVLLLKNLRCIIYRINKRLQKHYSSC